MDKFFNDEHSHHKTDSKKQQKKKIDVRFILFLIKDSLHNLTDGIAISAIYKLNPEAGMLMAISLFTEELFH